MKFYVILLSVLVLSSCASMSKEECASANWVEIGKKDGSLGRSMRAFDSYVKSCGKADITPDKTAYMNGRDDGLEKYCTIQKGYEIGEENLDYSGVCINHNEAAVLEGRRLGLELYSFYKAYEDANAKVKKINDDISAIEDEIEKLTMEMNEDDISYYEREQKNNLISSNKINLSALKHTRYSLVEKAEEKLKLYEAKKKSHVNQGYCSGETCFTKK